MIKVCDNRGRCSLCNIICGICLKFPLHKQTCATAHLRSMSVHFYTQINLFRTENNNNKNPAPLFYRTTVAHLLLVEHKWDKSLTVTERNSLQKHKTKQKLDECKLEEPGWTRQCNPAAQTRSAVNVEPEPETAAPVFSNRTTNTSRVVKVSQMSQTELQQN